MLILVSLLIFPSERRDVHHWRVEGGRDVVAVVEVGLITSCRSGRRATLLSCVTQAVDHLSDDIIEE